jgi:hypothetical protein
MMLDGSDSSDAGKPQSLTHRELAELIENQGWVHHVAYLDTGEVITTPLDRPLAPLSRAERLARFGYEIGWPIPWGRVDRLTPNSPYQAAPLNWLEAYHSAQYLTDGSGGSVAWSFPEDYVPDPLRFPELVIRFSEPPQRRSVVTVELGGRSWSGVGHVQVTVYSSPAPQKVLMIPFTSSYDFHTVDVTFSPAGSIVAVAVKSLAGLEYMAFFSITLQAAEPVLAPP